MFLTSLSYRQNFQIPGITFQITADKPLGEDVFGDKLRMFATPAPGDDVIVVRYHFSLPEDDESTYGNLVYHAAPWRIYHGEVGWTYVGFTSDPRHPIFQVGRMDENYRAIDVYFPSTRVIERGNLESLVLIATDQIILTPILALRQAAYIHSSGVIFNGGGLLFVGRSGAGKSTMVRQLRDEAGTHAAVASRANKTVIRKMRPVTRKPQGS